MTSFNVGGRYLDLPANFELQFVKKNANFAFDDLECERTTSFSVPKTANNMQIFGFGNDYHRYGMSMRRRVFAQMQNGVVVKDGYLYISKFSSNKFDCIFVTGELLFLRMLRELGDISQFIDSNLICKLDAPIKNAYDSKNNDAARINYMTDGYVQPSWLLSTIAQQAVTNSGASVDFGTTLAQLEGYRIIPNKAQGVPETGMTMTRTWRDYPTENSPYPVENDLTITGADLFGIITTDSSALVQMVTNSWDNPILLYGYFKQWVTTQKVKIKFDETTPADIFLCEASTGGVGFLGDYSFSKNSDGSVNYSGTPLAGREVELDVGQKFILLTPDDLHSENEAPYAVSGFSISLQTISCNVWITGENDQPTNATIRARDNMPEMTVIDLLKAIAALTGRVLSVHNGQVVFVEDVTAGEMIYGVRAIKNTDLVRTFADYAQQNSISFDSDEEIPSDERVMTFYTIDNENIAIENELLVFPFSEGGVTIDGDDTVLFVRGEFDGFTLGVGKYGGFYMYQISLPKNESLQQILDVSTSIELQCRFSADDFEKLRADKLIYYDGAKWVWTQVRWSRGIADLSLSKI